MAALDVIIGNTGGGLIDYLIWGVFQPGSNWYWVLVVGPVFFVVYYRVFKWYLTKKKLSIDVADEEETDGKQGVSMDEQQKAKAVKIIEGLGGFGNIGVVNNCLTRFVWISRIWLLLMRIFSRRQGQWDLYDRVIRIFRLFTARR